MKICMRRKFDSTCDGVFVDMLPFMLIVVGDAKFIVDNASRIISSTVQGLHLLSHAYQRWIGYPAYTGVL